MIRLIVFDVDGVLLKPHKKNRVPLDEAIALVRELMTLPNLKIAIWTSATHRNIRDPLQKAFGELTRNFFFVWCRDRTVIDRRRGEHHTIKPVVLITENPIIQEQLPDLRGDEILIVDNDIEKIYMNPLPHRWTSPNDFRETYPQFFVDYSMNTEIDHWTTLKEDVAKPILRGGKSSRKSSGIISGRSMVNNKKRSLLSELRSGSESLDASWRRQGNYGAIGPKRNSSSDDGR